mmetsp:Transcript_84704/g.226434  ORF Transcript_84704/g.226434 Transcript_84704/m.226434 type:complete len:218 (-) Transcript_84704:420-1073(-)
MLRPSQDLLVVLVHHPHHGVAEAYRGLVVAEGLLGTAAARGSAPLGGRRPAPHVELGVPLRILRRVAHALPVLLPRGISDALAPGRPRLQQRRRMDILARQAVILRVPRQLTPVLLPELHADRAGQVAGDVAVQAGPPGLAGGEPEEDLRAGAGGVEPTDLGLGLALEVSLGEELRAHRNVQSIQHDGILGTLLVAVGAGDVLRGVVQLLALILRVH